MTISNCAFDAKITTLNGHKQGTVTGDDWKAATQFINPIKCTEDENGYCHAEYDRVGNLTPNVPEQSGQSSSESSDDSKKDFFKCYTWHFEELCDDNPRKIDTWYALEYLLLISCLPTDPAKDIWYDVQ